MPRHRTPALPRPGKWTIAQLKLAVALYCQTPFGKLHGNNPEIVELATLIGRTPDALAMKLSNFASLDPAITETGRKGLRGASALDRAIWNEFHTDWDRLAVECAQIHQQLLLSRGDQHQAPASDGGEAALADFTGATRQAIVEQRIKQQFFRRAVLANYGGRCCISDVGDSRLLVASHIVPWSVDKANRLNPRNGLCLSAIHDKAFDGYLFSLSDDYRVVLSKQLEETPDKFLQQVFWPVQGQHITLPERFCPEPAFLQMHRQTMLSAQPRP